MENIKDIILKINNLSISYTAGKKAVDNVSAEISRKTITAVMGPSGCGKSTVLRAINRMHELYRDIKVEGEILLNGENIFAMNAGQLRRRVGMVFQRPNPFPNMSIAQNVLAGYTLNGIKISKSEKAEITERSLRSVGLWDEVKDSLQKRGSFLSGGQQQRLCIARALALEPEVLLMDEPTSALDPIASNTIEDLILQLKKELTVVIVTHNLQQAARISDYSLFMYLGEAIEFGTTEKMFRKPENPSTEAYLTGNFG